MGLMYSSGRMSPERTQRLITEIKAWCEAHQIKQVELARRLSVSPQLVTEWIKGRKQPTGEQALHMLELLKAKPQAAKKIEGSRRQKSG
jgi:DNA-binding transcriptional regulator YiaG